MAIPVQAIEKGLRLAFLIAFQMLLAVLNKFLEACGCGWHGGRSVSLDPRLLHQVQPIASGLNKEVGDLVRPFCCNDEALNSIVAVLHSDYRAWNSELGASCGAIAV